MTGVLLIVAGVILIGAPLFAMELAATRWRWLQALRNFTVTVVGLAIFLAIILGGWQLIQLGVRQL